MRGGDTVTLMVSRSPSAGFVELTRVAPASADEIETTTITSTMTAPVHIGEDSADLIAALEANGHAKLAGLNFPSGSSELDAGPIAALETLAIWLADNPGMTIALVGHTDAVGALDGNIRLSKRRAASVRDRLVEAHGIAANRIEAEGVGYLAPIASNQSDETRGLNRRVEVVITATP
jgi:OOP family OmpA-OmpF porin